jgi:quinol monooxygenase YgiN
MSIYSIWESWFPFHDSDEGVAVTQAIWRDMLDFDGYMSHDLLVDADDPGHLLVVSQWKTKGHADAALESYKDHSNAQHADRLVSEPRRRFVARQVSGDRSPRLPKPGSAQ